MKKLLLTALLTAVFIGQSSGQSSAFEGEDIYGTYKNFAGDQILQMIYTHKGPSKFLRTFEGGYAKGTFTLYDKYIYVEKENESYKLRFYLKGLQLVVTKPVSAKGPGQAWLFTKVSNYTQ